MLALLRVVWSGGQQVLMWLLSEHAGLMIGTLLVMMARLTMCLVMTPGSKHGKTGVQMHVPLLWHLMTEVLLARIAMTKVQGRLLLLERVRILDFQKPSMALNYLLQHQRQIRSPMMCSQQLQMVSI